MKMKHSYRVSFAVSERQALTLKMLSMWNAKNDQVPLIPIESTCSHIHLYTYPYLFPVDFTNMKLYKSYGEWWVLRNEHINIM